MQELNNYVKSELADKILSALGWLDTENQLVKYSLRDEPIVLPMPKGSIDAAVAAGAIEWKLPAYSIRYLLAKLPTNVQVWKAHEANPDLPIPTKDIYHAVYSSATTGGINMTAETPEEALGLLVMQLVDSKVIQREGDAA